MIDDRIDPSGAARLYSVARALTGALSGREVAAALFDHALADLGINSAGLWMVEGSAIRFVGGAGMDASLPAEVLTMPVAAELPAAVVVRTGRPVTYRSRAERDRQWPLLIGVGTLSEAVAVLPLKLGSRVLGAMHIGYAVAVEGTDFEMPFLLRLAELAAAALDRAALYDSERDRQAFLLDASAAVAEGKGWADTLHRLAMAAVPRLGDLCLIDVRDERGAIRRMAAVHADPAAAELVEELGRQRPDEPHPAWQAMSERRPVWSADMSEDFLRRITIDERHFQLTRTLGFESFISVPLLSGTEVLGAITLVSAGSGRRFGALDAALAEELAWRVAGVVGAARRHDQEHELAHELQRLLLPSSLPAVPGVEIAARYLTAQSEAEAGGDFYDVVKLPSGRLGFVIGDVEGHDAGAAATMGQLRSAMRALAGQYREPADLIDALRWSWDLLGFSRMATCLLGRIDPTSGEVVLACAGHLPPVLIPAGGAGALVATESSPPLGAPGGPTVETRLVLGPGDTLLLYTDGLIEDRLTAIDTSLHRLLDSLSGVAGLDPEAICDRMVAAHVDLSSRRDDVAMLLLRRTGA